MPQHQNIEKKTTLVVNLKNVPINHKDLQNFMIESTNRAREEMKVQNERI
jgi:hypothetical protein